MKKLYILAVILFTIFFIGCDMSTSSLTTSSQTTTETTTSAPISVEDVVGEDVDFDDGYYVEYEEDDYVILDESSESYLITEEGTYVLTGTITETIVVQLNDEEDVRIILDNVTITSTENAAIMILSADDVEISIPEGTENYLSDSSNYTDENIEYNAVIYSEADLVINGLGYLNIDANYNNGIVSKDDLMIVDVTIELTSIDDGIIGRDSLLIQNADITLVVDGDGLVSTNEENTEEGYIYIESGTFSISSGSDSIDAVNYIIITDGEFDIQSDSKGLKSDTSIYISGGNITIDSKDDAINSNVGIEITGGTFQIDTDDDGIKGNELVVISGGVIVINSSYEGIESKSIYISGGTITVIASDDGINAASGTTNTTFFPSSPTTNSNGLTISGGLITVSASGDGVDINGSIDMTGGELYIYGPLSDRDGSIDYDGTYSLSGGVVFAIGSSGMAMAPSTSSSQASIMLGMTSSVSAGTDIIVYDENNNTIFSTTTQKSGINIVISVEAFTIGDEYTIKVGNSYELTFTLSSTVTYLGNTSSGTLPGTPGVRPR